MGILGSIHVSHPPLGEAETLEAITEIAYAHLGREPATCVYIADSENRWYKSLLNEKYHAALAQRELNQEVAWCVFFLCGICFLFSVICELGWASLVAFAVTAVLYLAHAYVKRRNTIEFFVVLVITLSLALLMLRVASRIQEVKRRVEAPKETQLQQSND